MAYPTGVAFKSTNAPMGSQPIHEASATKLHELGTILRATDVTYGEGEFIYLLGVASTAQGDLVAYNSKTGATVRAVAGGTGSQGPVAVACSDCTAGLYGWYQISGSAPWKAATVAADTDVYLSASASTVDDLVNVSDKVDGAAFKAATVSGYAVVQFNRPSVASESVASGFATAQADIDAIEALGAYCTLSAATEAADAIVVTGQVKTLDGVNVASATAVVVRTLAVTADKGDITVTTGTGKKTVNPATGENVCWLETDSSGAFAVSVANNIAEDTLITAVPDNGLVQQLKLTFV